MSASDYPEHLNPFGDEKKKKSGLHIGHSFKEFRKTLRQSFRLRKGKGEVQLRKQTDPRYPRQTNSHQDYKPPIVLNRENVCTPALPRSRFRERLAMSYSPSAPNPFEEDSDLNDETRVWAPRRKKRAPLPPRSSSSQNVNEERSLNEQSNSKWSLISSGTDVSTENISDTACHHNLDISNELQTITKEMVKMNENDDDEAEEVKSTEEMRDNNSRSNIPDVVVSCVDDEQSTCNEESTNIDDSFEDNTLKEEIREEDRNLDGLTKTDVKDKEAKNDCTIKYIDNEDSETEEDKIQHQGPSSRNSTVDLRNSNESSSNESLVVVDITSNLKNLEEPRNMLYDDKSHDGFENEEFAKKQETSSYEMNSSIKNEKEFDNVNDRLNRVENDASKDEKSMYSMRNNKLADVHYSEESSLYISQPENDLYEDNNNQINHDKNITSISPKPTPKQRKAKLTKDDLLLGQNNNNYYH